jgi:predicted Rossmann-fold nucleotide-binding protein
MGARNAIAVIGAGDATDDICATARELGRAIARNGAVLVCGGRGGVMEAAHIEFAIATGMGEARNAIVVASAAAVIALPGEAGTLSEIALALKIGRPVVAIGAWHEIAGVRRAEDARSAVALAFQLAGIALADENRND